MKAQQYQKKYPVFLILDFGSQYTWLITRCFRELGFYSQVETFDFPLEKIQKMNPAGIIISGGPSSVLEKDAPTRGLKELLSIAPLLGVCYGLQMICLQWGGKVVSSGKRTYGSSEIYWKKKLLKNSFSDTFVPKDFQKVWMSHGDFVSEVPKGFSILAETERKIPAVLESDNVLALQFHPEVSHTEKGKSLLSYFAKLVCGVKQGSWTADSMFSLLESQIQSQVLDSGHLLCALSGGVDSTVMACLLVKILGTQRIHCVFVDTGLLRENEFSETLLAYKKAGLKVKGISAKEKFLRALKGITDPEKKRKTIGHLFIDIFKEYKDQNSEVKYLAQGTLYPDVIESLSFKGPSATIKSHHNVGGLPKDMPFKLVEPLKFLFKDEVRILGETLNRISSKKTEHFAKNSSKEGDSVSKVSKLKTSHQINIKVPKELLHRHPFPGPGLAVRICGEVTKERLSKLRQADAIFINALKQEGLYEKIWQAFGVLLPVQSVGVQGDQRTYEEVIVLRAITSTDGMTADWFSFSSDFLHKISDAITNEVKGINRVVYDITSKPPATIEWL